ncbi:hypothetical protein BJY52DRAFT_452934 [Lactarius psammicola]|nr:hypothetical protein BJY52DRAFT_452934 [Lactarius psammicola]
MVAARSGSLHSSPWRQAIAITIATHKRPPLDGGSADPERDVVLIKAVLWHAWTACPTSTMSSARVATVGFMLQHKGHERVALDEQSTESGEVDRLFGETLAAGAPNALRKITVGVTQSGLSQGLLPGGLIYAPAEDLVDDELSSRMKGQVSDL